MEKYDVIIVGATRLHKWFPGLCEKYGLTDLRY